MTKQNIKRFLEKLGEITAYAVFSLISIIFISVLVLIIKTIFNLIMG